MSNQGGASFKVVEDAQEVIEDFGLSPQQAQTLGSEQNAGVAIYQQNITSRGMASHPLEDILPYASLEQQSLHRAPNPSMKRNLTSGAIPKTPKASGFMVSGPNPAISNPSDDSLAFWEDTGAIPKYLTQEYAAKAPKYLPPFKKPQSQRPKPNVQPTTVVPPRQPPAADLQQELLAELQELQRAEVHQDLQQNSQRPEEIAAELPQEFQRPELQKELSQELQQEPQLAEAHKEPMRERRSSRSEQAQFVREHCLDFQDYKRTVNNKQKCLEQSLNLILPKMNTAMVDAQNLATKIEKVRSQDCETEEALKIQNDKMKYLVGRTVGTISKIDGLFDRFRTDILDYTTLTTEGNAGIDSRLSKLLMILCGMDDKDPEKEENKVIRDSFEQLDDS